MWTILTCFSLGLRLAQHMSTIVVMRPKAALTLSLMVVF